MKRFFALPTSPSKAKYEAERSKLESALLDIESKKQVLFGPTDALDALVATDDTVPTWANRASPSASPTRPLSPTKTRSVAAFSRPSFSSDLPMSLAMAFSSVNASMRLSPSKAILQATNSETVWSLKEVYIVQDGSPDTKLGSVELHAAANLKAARELIVRFLPSAPKGFRFLGVRGPIDIDTEGMVFLQEAFLGDIRVQSLAPPLSKEERQRRNLVRERQQAAFEHFVQRRTQEPKPNEVPPTVVEEVVAKPPPVVAPKPAPEPVAAAPKPPKQVLLTATRVLADHECDIKILYFPTLSRVVVRAKVVDAAQHVTLALQDAEFRKLVGASDTESLLALTLDEASARPILDNLLLVVPDDAFGLFQLRLRRFVVVSKARKEPSPVLFEAVDAQPAEAAPFPPPLRSPPRVPVVPDPVPEKHTKPARSPPKEKPPAPTAPEPEVRAVAPVEVAPARRVATSPPKPRDKHKAPSPVHAEPKAAPLEVRATTAAPAKHRVATVAPPAKPTADEHHRRLRASLELAARKSSLPADDEEAAPAPVVPAEELHVKIALKKLRAFVRSGAAISMYHNDGHRDDIERLYAASNPRSISLGRHCLVGAFWEFLVARAIVIPTHPVAYSLEQHGAVPLLLLAIEDEVAVCDGGYLRDIQHDLRKVVLDDVAGVAHIVEQTTPLSNADVALILSFEAKLALLCHASRWTLPTALRTAIFEGVFPLQSKKELPLEAPALTYISAKEMPFKATLIKSYALLEPELQALLELLYILVYSYYHSPRCTDKRLRQFTVAASTPAGRIEAMLQAIDERQGKLKELQLAFSDVALHAFRERIRVLVPLLPHAKVVARTSKLPTFFKGLAAYLGTVHGLFATRLVAALRTRHAVQSAQTARFLLELVKAHVHDAPAPSPSIGDFFVATMAPFVGLDKVNGERHRLRLGKVALHSEFCLATHGHCAALSGDDALRRRARWDSPVDIPSTTLQRYFFKGEHEVLCEFVALVPVPDTTVVSEAVEEDAPPPPPPRWDQVQAVYATEAGRVWAHLLQWHQQKTPAADGLRAHVAFGLNIRQATGSLLTPEMLADTNLHFFLLHPSVHFVAVAYVACDQLLRVTVRFYQEVAPSQRALGTHRGSRFEHNAFNELLAHVGAMPASAVGVFLLQKGLQFITQNLFDERQAAWDALPEGRPLYDMLVERRLTARYAEELMEIALDKIFTAIGDNAALLTPDIVALLLGILQRANDTCMDKDDSAAVVQTTFEFIAAGTLRLLQHLLAPPVPPVPETVPSMSSVMTLPPLAHKQKCFIDCDGLGLLHDMISLSTFAEGTVFVDEASTRTVVESLIVRVLLTRELCSPSRALIVHHRLWAAYVLPRVESGELEAYGGAVLQALMDVILGSTEKHMLSFLIQCNCGCPRNVHWTSDVYEALVTLFLDLLATKAGVRWAQEHDMAGVLALLRPFELFYVQLLTERSGLQPRLLATVYALARKVKQLDNLVKLLDVVPVEVLGLYTRGKVPHLTVDLLRLLASLLHLGLLRKVPHVAVGVFGVVFADLTQLLVDAVMPTSMDIVPALWSDADLTKKVFRGAKVLGDFGAEHRASLGLDTKATDRDGAMPSLLLLYISLLDAKLDKPLLVLQLPALMGLICMCYDPVLAHVCIKEHVLCKLLDLHESVSLPYVSTRQQLCIWATALLCAHVALDGSLAANVSAQTMKRVLQHSYSSIVRINRSRSNAFESYVNNINRAGTVGLFEPAAGSGKRGHELTKTLTSLKAKLKAIEADPANLTARDAPAPVLSKQEQLLEWEDKLEANVGDRDDRTSTVYFILMDALSSMTSSVGAIRDSDEVKVVAQSIVGYFIAEELTPPEYFVAAYCFALKNIVFAAFRASSLNEIWEQATLSLFLRKLFGFVCTKKSATMSISLGQEFALELLWGLVLVSRGKEAWFLKDDSDAPPPTPVVPLKASISVLTKALVDDAARPPPLDAAKLKVLGDAAGSADPVVCEYACAVLATLVADPYVARFFFVEIGYNKLLTMVQQQRNKGSTRHLHVFHDADVLDESALARQVGGANLLYDAKYKLNREVRGLLQLLRLVATCIRIVAKTDTLSSDFITKSEKPTKDNFVSLLHHLPEPPALVQVLRGVRYLIPLAATQTFDAYFTRAEFERLYKLCLDPTTSESVQIKALKCARYLLRKYAINTCLARMLYDGRLHLVLLFGHIHIELQIEAVYMLFEVAMIYINKKQRRALAATFETPETRPILATLFAKFDELVHDDATKSSAQLLMDILIRLIIQLDLLNSVNDDFLVEAICHMIETISPDGQANDGAEAGQVLMHTPLRPMLCAALAKLVCKGHKAPWFLRTSRLDTIVKILSQESTLGELMDLACILLTLAREEAAIAAYLGTAASQAIKHVCHVLGSFYELQMVNSGPTAQATEDMDDEGKEELLEDEGEVATSADMAQYRKFRTVKQRLLLKIFFPKTEELKVSRHLHQIYKYYLKLLEMIFDVHGSSVETHGCRCTTRNGCSNCAPADLLRKANGAHICRWLLLSKRISVAHGSSYMTAPERDADSIVFHTLRLLRAASFNHLFRKEFLEGGARPLGSQSVTALHKIRDLCANVNHPKLLLGKATLLDPVVILGQLCAEDGLRDYLGVTLELAAYVFAIIADKRQAAVPLMTRACTLVLCRLASSDALLHHGSFKRTLRLTGGLLRRNDVLADAMSLNNLLMFYRNTMTYGKAIAPLVLDDLSDEVLAALGRQLKVTLAPTRGFDVETAVRMAAADALAQLLFSQHKGVRQAFGAPSTRHLSLAKVRQHALTKGPSHAAPEQPVAAVFRKIGRTWHQHLDNLSRDDITALSPVDEKLAVVYASVYGEKSELRLFLDLLNILTKLPPVAPPQKARPPPSVLTPAGALAPAEVPVFFAMEHPVPSDLRDYSCHMYVDYVPGSASLWRVLRKLLRNCMSRKLLTALSEAQTALLLRLLAVCAPEGRTALSAASATWLTDVELEYIRFVHDVVHTHPRLHNPAIFDTVSATAHRYFAAAARDTDPFSSRMRGFVLLHAFAQDTACIATLATYLVAVLPTPPPPLPEGEPAVTVDPMELSLPVRARDALGGLALLRRKTTWKSKDRAKPLSFAFLAPDVAQLSMLPYALGVFSALVSTDSRFLTWFVYLGGFSTLLEILELELEFHDVAVVPSRVTTLRLTLELMRQSLEEASDRPLGAAIIANHRLFQRVLSLAAHTKLEVKQAAMGVMAALTRTSAACDAVFAMQAHCGLLPCADVRDGDIIRAHVDVLRLLFGATVTEHEGQLFFVDTNTTVDARKFSALASLRPLHLLKPATLARLSRGLEGPAPADSKALVLLSDGRAVNVPLWLIERYVERESFTNLSHGADGPQSHVVVDLVGQLNALLATFLPTPAEKGLRLSRAEYMTAVDEKERTAVARALWRTLQQLPAEAPKRLPLVQQICRALIEDQAQLNRTVRRATRSVDGHVLGRRQRTLHGLFAYLRRALLLRSLSLEAVGALCRHMPPPVSFCEDTLEHALVLVNQGEITIARRPSVFAFPFDAPPTPWKRTFGPGDIVWCPRWLTTNGRIQPYERALYHVQHCVPHTTVFVWTQEMHEYYLPVADRDVLSVDVAEMVATLEAGVSLSVPTRLTAFCKEDAALRRLQTFGLATLGNLARGSRTFAAAFVADAGLINAVVSLAFSTLATALVTAAIDTLCIITAEPAAAQQLYVLCLDRFAPTPVLQGVLDAMELWCVQPRVAERVLRLLRQLYTNVPEAPHTVARMWLPTHYATLRAFLSVGDTALAAAVAGLVRDLLAPTLAPAFTAGGLHLAFAHFVGHCPAEVLPDVLYIVLSFCANAKTKAAIWARGAFHAPLHATLARMVVMLDSGNVAADATPTFVAFFNVLTFSEVSSEMDAAYRAFLGGHTALATLLVARIVDGGPAIDMYLNCLWRLCHGNASNAHRVGGHATDVRHGLAALAATPAAPAFANSLKCIRSLATDPANADAFSAAGVLDVLFAYVGDEAWQLPEVAIALQAMGCVFQTSVVGRGLFSPHHLALVATLYDQHLARRPAPAELTAWGDVLVRLVALLGAVVVDARTRQMVWTHCHRAAASALGWASWMQLLHPPQQPTTARLGLPAQHAVHDLTIALLAELCREPTIARDVAAHPHWCGYFCDLLLAPGGRPAEILAALRLLVAVAEVCTAEAVPIASILPVRARVYALLRLVGAPGVDALIFRLLWLWEAQARDLGSEPGEHLLGHAELHLDVFSYRLLARAATAVRDRSIFLGFLVQLLPTTWRLASPSVVTARLVASHVYLCLQRLPAAVDWSLLPTVETDLYRYCAWCDEVLGLGALLQVVRLVGAVVRHEPLHVLLPLPAFHGLLDHAVALVVAAVIALPPKQVAAPLTHRLLEEWAIVLEYSFNCRVLPFERRALQAFVDKVLGCLPELPLAPTVALLRCLHALCEKNVEVGLALRPLKLVARLEPHLSSAEDDEVDGVLRLLQAVVAASFRDGQDALQSRLPQRCLQLLEDRRCVPAACLLLVRLARVVGVSAAAPDASRLLTALLVLDITPAECLPWLGLLDQLFLAIPGLGCSIASAWEPAGQACVRRLFACLRCVGPESEIPRHEAVAFTAMRALSHLLAPAEPRLIQCVLALDDAWQDVVDAALRPVHEVNLYAVVVLEAALGAASPLLSGSALLSSLRQLFEDAEVAVATPLYFELLAVYFEGMTVAGTHLGQCLADSLHIEWPAVVERCAVALADPHRWSRRAALEFLHAFLLSPLHAMILEQVAVPTLGALKASVQKIIDSAEAVVLEKEQAAAFPCLGISAPMGVDDGGYAIYMLEPPEELHVAPVTARVAGLGSPHASRHVLSLLRYGNAGLLRLLLQHTSTRRTTVVEPKQRLAHLAGRKRGTVAVPKKSFRRQLPGTPKPPTALGQGAASVGDDARRLLAMATACLRLLWRETGFVPASLRLNVTATVVTHAFVNADTDATDLEGLWAAVTVAADAAKADLVTSNPSLIVLLLRLSGSVASLSRRKLATALLWKIVAAVSDFALFQALLRASKATLLDNLQASLVLEAPVLGPAVSDCARDLLQVTCGLLAALARAPDLLDAVLSHGFVGLVLHVVQVERPAELPAANVLFLQLVESVVSSAEHEARVSGDIDGLVQHCLHCLELDNSVELRAKAVHVLFLVCARFPGRRALEARLFPSALADEGSKHSKVSVHSLQAVAHLFVLTETLKLHDSRASERAATFLVRMFCDDTDQRSRLCGCRVASPESLVELLVGVLEATVGTPHRNRVSLRAEPLPPVVVATGLAALECLARLDIHVDAFRSFAVGSRIVVQLFAAMGVKELEVSFAASSLLVSIVAFAADPAVESLLASAPRDEAADDSGDDEDDGPHRPSLLRKVSFVQLNAHLPMDHPKRHALNRLRCFRHKIGGELPSYYELLAARVDAFAEGMATPLVPLLTHVFTLLHTVLRVFYGTIYMPVTEGTRVQHQHLVATTFRIAFTMAPPGDAAWERLQVEAMAALMHLCNHVGDYGVALFESATAIETVLQRIRLAAKRGQVECAQLLRAITRHDSVKAVVYAHELYAFLGWMNEPVFADILQALMHAAKNLLVASTVPGYDPVRLARLLLSETPVASSSRSAVLAAHATLYRRLIFRVGLEAPTTRELKVMFTVVGKSSRVVERRYCLRDALRTAEETLLCPLDVQSVECKVLLGARVATTTYTVAALEAGGVVSSQLSLPPLETSATARLAVDDAVVCDLGNLSGPLGDVLSFCVHHEHSTEVDLVAELLGELCKHDTVFCDPSLHLWSFVAFLLHYGSPHAQHCLKALADSAAPDHPAFHTYLRHALALVQMLSIYGLSSDVTHEHDWPSACLRRKEATAFLLAVGNMVAHCASNTTAEAYMSLLLLEHAGVIKHLCAAHRRTDHLCCAHLKLQSTLASVWPAHARTLAGARFVAANLAHFEFNTHLSDTSIDQAATAVLQLVVHSSACHKFVLNDGLVYVGKLAHVLYSRYHGVTAPHKIAPILRTFVLISAFLRTNLLVLAPLPPQIHAAFFPATMATDVMPFLEIVLWPLLPHDGHDVWLDTSMLASTLLAQIVETCIDRPVLEGQVLGVAFRLGPSRAAALQRAVRFGVRLRAPEHAFAVRVVQKIYFLAVIKGIKTGILSAECKELLPMQAVLQLDALDDDEAKGSDPLGDALRYCVQFTEQHHGGRLRDILVRNRKKGIGDMLRAVDPSARVVVFVHRVLHLVLETYIGVVASAPETIHGVDAKVARVRNFCRRLETLALLVLSVLDQLDAAYFGHIFYQFHEIRFPDAKMEANVVERRHFMRNNMKKVLFILKRIVDRKKLQAVLDETSFSEAETVLRDIRLEFAVNGRRRLGQACAPDASVADLFCEAVEVAGMGPFGALLAGARYLYARSMRKDDNSSYRLEEFMVGRFQDVGLVEALKRILTKVMGILRHPIAALAVAWQRVRGVCHSRTGGDDAHAQAPPTVARRRSLSLAENMFEGVDRPAVSFFPVASVLSLPLHATAASADRFFHVLRQRGTERRDDGAVVAKERFVERLVPTFPAAKQDVLRAFLTSGELSLVEGRLDHGELCLLRQKLEASAAVATGDDIKLDVVQHATLPMNAWHFILGPVKHTRLLHVEYLLEEIVKVDAATSADAAAVVSGGARHLRNIADAKKLSGIVVLPLRPKPMVKPIEPSKRQLKLRRVSSRRALKQWVVRSMGMASYVELDDRKSVDDIRKEPTAVIFAEYVLPVTDGSLEDPLSEQMAWGYLVSKINRNLFPRWVFEVDDVHVPWHRRAVARGLRAFLRAFLTVTFWRLEELRLDLQDDSWPVDDLLRCKYTTRTKLAQDIVHSIVVYEHFAKAVSELCAVWMKESGSLGLRLWQHWSFFAVGWAVPSLLFHVVLPMLDASSSAVDYFMKWFMAGFFVLIYSLVVLSILQLIKQSENMMVQERQAVRFYPVVGFHGNYLALYGLFMELVQQNTIPFSNTVQWVSGFQVPKLMAALGALGITGLNIDALGLTAHPLDLLYLKAYVAFAILFLYLVLLKCANKFHKSYPNLNKRLTKDLPPIISSILFVAIVNTFLSFLFCCTCDQFQDAAAQCTHTEPFLYAYPTVDLVCWSPDHLPLAFVGLVGLTFFLPIGILSAGMAEVLFPREDVDIKFSPIIVLASQMGKTISIVAGLFFTFYREYMVSISVGTNVVLFLLTVVCKTSSIWYVSIVKAFIYVMSVWTSLCALVNLTLATPNSGPVIYLNVGWFVIFCTALVVLALEMRLRNVREEAARKERLRDYKLLNGAHDVVRLTDMEEDFLRRARKPTTPAQLEALAPPGFLAAARAKAKALESQELPPHLDDFLEKARRSAARPSKSETMFLRRGRRLGHRIALFEATEHKAE
ncbi:hypothetical protein ACHHYP_08656 [Achlya hypogyna]|uniref:SWIM-type domain-containing protein n=1 Tax=Achlya hypogyna TaxID=1202772 RepID=A0A1V9ZKH6_ACHHY|nr:hypothetical protein ACHHYP_08656 [Achlya hypogyna]